MVPRSPLDDPHAADFAWKRYRRLMKWMALATLVVVVAAIGLLFAHHGMVSIHLYIAAALGVGLTVLLAAALMGLVFLSSGTGHDESIVDPVDHGWKDQSAGRKR